MNSAPSRNTAVVSISLPPRLVRLLDALRRQVGMSRSSAIASLIERYAQERRWEQIRAWGKETARKFKITSEEDVEKLLQKS